MKLISTEHTKFLALQAQSVGTPYRDILTFAERLADELEKEFEFTSYNDIIYELEKRSEIQLSIGDCGEIFVILASYWIYGERLLEHLTWIESKIVAENVEHRLSVLSQGSETSA